MKSVLLFAFGMLLLASCTTTEKMLMRNWEVTDVVILDSLSPLLPLQKEILTNALKTNVTMSPGKDSAYHIVSGPNVFDTKWWLSRDKKILYVLSPENQVVPNRIVRLDKTLLVYETELKDSVVMRFTCNAIAGKK